MTMSTMTCVSMWIAVLSILFVVQSLIAAVISSRSSALRSGQHHHPSSSRMPDRTDRRHHRSRQRRHRHRSLQNVDGVTACSDCVFANGQQCVGRTVQDENCDACSRGQLHWPCDMVSECWCWDTSMPRDPGDEGAEDLACKGCGTIDTEECVGNQNSLTPVADEDCAGCMSGGQSYWPCDDPDLCWCWDSTKPKQPPAPASGFAVAVDVPGPCSILTEEMFGDLAPNSTFPYTYEGLCAAIDAYNLHHTEKFAAMGTEGLIRAELAAFLGNTAHESDDFEAGREYLACGDRKEVEGKVYCKPCNHDLYDWINNTCSESMVALNSPYNSYCQPSFVPPAGCSCDTITQVEEEGDLAGYVEASKVFYGRGAIQLSWNYNYIRASVALTGDAETFCVDPEQIATSPEYAWGTGIYFWMENVKEEWTCHKEILMNEDFGGTLNNINGGLECPAYKGGWHASAIKMRLNRYCHAASLLGMTEISSLDGCSGMSESFAECLADGHCPYCGKYAGGLPTNFSDSTEAELTADDESEESEELVPSPSPAETSEMPTPGLSIEMADLSTDSPTLTAMPTPVLLAIVDPFPTPSPSLTGESTKSPSKGDGSTSQTIAPTLEASTNTTTTSLSDEIETLDSTDSPVMAPSSIPTTTAPSSSKPSTTAPTTTALPSLTPTTPPLGECEGEPCPNNMCRSLYGFCGAGSLYCTDDAIWTPECPEETEPPTPSFLQTAEPTAPPAEQSTANLGSDSPTPNLANVPTPNLDSVGFVTTAPVLPEFSKPSGGGKKPGGKPKPSSGSSGSPQITDEVTDQPTITVTTKVSATTSDSGTASPTQSLTEKGYSPTDPEANFFCGVDWDDANTSCSKRCPSSKSEDCDEGYKCFAFTSCLVEQLQETGYVIDPPTNPPSAVDNDEGLDFGTNQPSAIHNNVEDFGTNPPTAIDNEGGDFGNAPETNDQSNLALLTNDPESVWCTGSPCPFVGECRSQYGFCGSQFIYCNDLSSWKLDDCGLSGTDEKGDPVLCDSEAFKCPEGEEVYRDPSNKCDFFPCPVDDEEASEMTSSSFNLPASSPSGLSELPMPTLPAITQAVSFNFSTVTKPSTGIIDLDTNPTALSNNTIVTFGTGGDIADDGDELSNTTEQLDPSTSNANSDFSGFNAETDALLRDWMESSADISHACGHLWALLTTMMLSILAM